jgi:hypothetical protein
MVLLNRDRRKFKLRVWNDPGSAARGYSALKTRVNALL